MRFAMSFALLLAVPDLVSSGEPAPRVTTDSREYCVELADRFVVLPGAREEAPRRMAEDGMRLCETGHHRTGVAKLRRAIRAATAVPGG